MGLHTGRRAKDTIRRSDSRGGVEGAPPRLSPRWGERAKRVKKGEFGKSDHLGEGKRKEYFTSVSQWGDSDGAIMTSVESEKGGKVQSDRVDSAIEGGKHS